MLEYKPPRYLSTQPTNLLSTVCLNFFEAYRLLACVYGIFVDRLQYTLNVRSRGKQLVSRVLMFPSTSSWETPCRTRGKTKLQWNPALRTPALYGQFRLSRQKVHIFSLKLTRFIRTPDTFLGPKSQTLIYCQLRFTDTGYLQTVYFHCHNYVIIVDIVPCSNNDRFLRVNKILLQY